MDKADIEEAISKLTRMLADGEAAEAEYQQLFEDHPSVLESLGFSQQVPHPRLETTGREYLEPDFIARRGSDPATIVELKTPQESVIRYRKNRTSLLAEMSSYVAQVTTYADYFDDPAAAAAINDEYGIEVWKDPPSLIIAGSGLESDKQEIHKQLVARTARMNLLSYDDVLRSMMDVHSRLFGAEDLLGSVSAIWSGRVDDPAIGRRQYLMDIGDAPQLNRWAVFFDAHGQLTLELTDRIGRSYSVSAPANVSRPGPIDVAAEFSNGPDGAMLRIVLDDRVVALASLGQRVEISGGVDFESRVLGASIERTDSLEGQFFAAAVFTFLPTDSERRMAFQELHAGGR